MDPFHGSTNDPDNGSGWDRNGEVAVAVHACDVPYAPDVRTVDARDTSATVEFYPEDGDQVTAAPTGSPSTAWATTARTLGDHAGDGRERR